MRLGTAIERLVDNYRYASDKDWIMDKVAWALYQTWKEADRNTDLQTETKTETQNSNLTFKKRTMCDCYNCKRFETDDECIECHHEPRDEPQTDYGDFANRLAYERGVKHAWEVAQKVFDSTLAFYKAEDLAKQIDKTEPQTERSSE